MRNIMKNNNFLTVALDVDGILCSDLHERFKDAEPRQEYIDFVNWMYTHSVKIIVMTYKKNQEDMDTRIKQLDSWGLKYHEIRSKPFYDFIIDDKAIAGVDLMKKLFEKMKGEKFYEQ